MVSKNRFSVAGTELRRDIFLLQHLPPTDDCSLPTSLDSDKLRVLLRRIDAVGRPVRLEDEDRSPCSKARSCSSFSDQCPEASAARSKVQQESPAGRRKFPMQIIGRVAAGPSNPDRTESPTGKNKVARPSRPQHLHQVGAGYVRPGKRRCRRGHIVGGCSSRSIKRIDDSGSISGSSPCTLTMISSGASAPPRFDRSRSA